MGMGDEDENDEDGILISHLRSEPAISRTDMGIPLDLAPSTSSSTPSRAPASPKRERVKRQGSRSMDELLSKKGSKPSTPPSTSTPPASALPPTTPSTPIIIPTSRVEEELGPKLDPSLLMTRLYPQGTWGNANTTDPWLSLRDDVDLSTLWSRIESCDELDEAYSVHEIGVHVAEQGTMLDLGSPAHREESVYLNALGMMSELGVFSTTSQWTSPMSKMRFVTGEKTRVVVVFCEQNGLVPGGNLDGIYVRIMVEPSKGGVVSLRIVVRPELYAHSTIWPLLPSSLVVSQQSAVSHIRSLSLLLDEVIGTQLHNYDFFPNAARRSLLLCHIIDEFFQDPSSSHHHPSTTSQSSHPPDFDVQVLSTEPTVPRR